MAPLLDGVHKAGDNVIMFKLLGSKVLAETNGTIDYDIDTFSGHTADAIFHHLCLGINQTLVSSGPLLASSASSLFRSPLYTCVYVCVCVCVYYFPFLLELFSGSRGCSNRKLNTVAEVEHRSIQLEGKEKGARLLLRLVRFDADDGGTM